MHDDRAVRWEKTIEIRVRRYQDGGWRGCVSVPTARGVTLACVEYSPRDIARARDVLRGTQDSCAKLARAARNGGLQTADTVGWYGAADIVGLAEDLTPPDIIGQLAREAQRILRPAARELAQLAPHAGRRWLAGQPDLVGLPPAAGAAISTGLQAVRGSQFVQDFERGISEFGQQLSGERDWESGELNVDVERARALAPERARQWAILGDPARSAAERAAAYAYLVTVIRMNPGAADLRVQKARGEMIQETSVAPLRPAGPPLLEAIYTYKAPEGAYVGPTQASIDWAAARRPVEMQATTALRPTTTLPGGAAVGARGGVDAGGVLGAQELLAQVRDVAIPAAADITERSLRAVDAAAGASLGSSEARAVLRRAIRSQSDRVRSALTIARAILDLR